MEDPGNASFGVAGCALDGARFDRHGLACFPRGERPLQGGTRARGRARFPRRRVFSPHVSPNSLH